MPALSSLKKSTRKYFKISRYIRKYGTAEKIEAHVNKYLDTENNKIKIEDLLRDISQITLNAVIRYIQKNRNMYLEYGPKSVIHEAFLKLCKVYDGDEAFSIVIGDTFESKYEKTSFRKIKCLWVFHELAKILRDKENKGKEKINTLNFIEGKLNQIKPALEKCESENLEFTLGVEDFNIMMLAPYGIRPDGVPITSSSKTRKNSARFDLKKSPINY